MSVRPHPRRALLSASVALTLTFATGLLSGCAPAESPTPSVPGGLPVDPDSALGLPALLGFEPVAKPELRALTEREASAMSSVEVVNPDECAPALPDRVLCEFLIRFSTVPSGVVVGSVVASSVADAAPAGLLVKVTAVDGNVVTAVEANLGQALERGEFQVERTFDASQIEDQVLAPGVTLASARTTTTGASIAPAAAFIGPRTEAAADDLLGFKFAIDHVKVIDGVYADGSIGLGLTCGAYGGLTWDSFLGIPYPDGVYFDARCGPHQEGSVTLSAEVPASLEATKIEIAKFNLTPITFTIGPVPVVLVPRITISFQADGSLSAGMSFTASEHFTAIAGIAYNDGFHLIKDFSSGFDSETSIGSGRLSAKAAVVAEESLLLYGLVGPAISEELYLSLVGKPPGEKPVWCLSGGLSGSVGINIDLEITELRWGPEEIFNDSTELSCAPNQAPTLDILSPLAPVYPGTSGVAKPVFRAIASDLEDGSLTVTWHSDRDGDLGETKSNADLVVPGLSLGTHHITATTTDHDGATATEEFTVESKDGAPSLTFLVQDAGGAFVAASSLSGTKGGTGYIRAQMSSPVPLTVGTCGNMSWQSALPIVDLGTGRCDFSISYNQVGTFPVTATVTDGNGKKGTASFTVKVAPAPVVVPLTLTPITAATMVGDSVPNDGVVRKGDEVVMVVNSNSQAAGIPVRYDWAIQSSGPSGTSAWQPLTGSGDSAVGSVRVYTVPGNLVFKYQVRVQLVNATTGAAVPGEVRYLTMNFLNTPA